MVPTKCENMTGAEHDKVMTSSLYRVGRLSATLRRVWGRNCDPNNTRNDRKQSAAYGLHFKLTVQLKAKKLTNAVWEYHDLLGRI